MFLRSSWFKNFYRHLDEGVISKLPVKRFRLLPIARGYKCEGFAYAMAINFCDGGSVIGDCICWVLWDGRNLRCEKANLATSKTIYAQSWQAKVESAGDDGSEILVTGYSCRSQVKRLSGRAMRHPVSNYAQYWLPTQSHRRQTFSQQKPTGRWARLSGM